MSKQTEEIRRRLAAATPGPWRVGHDGPSKPIIIPQTVTDLWGFDDLEEENAELIAHAPIDLAFLLAENERLEREVAGLRDSPELDGTSYEHPAYRRGDDHGSAVTLQTKQQNAALHAEAIARADAHRQSTEKMRAEQSALRTALSAAGRVIEEHRKDTAAWMRTVVLGIPMAERLTAKEFRQRGAELENAKLAYAEALKEVK